MNIGSNYVEVFPATKRSLTSPQSRITSEKNLVSIVNKLIDTEGFVISPSLDSPVIENDSTTIEFDIYGYYFVIKNPYTSLGLGSTITNGSLWAYIELVPIADTPYIELFGQDSDDQYTGLNILNVTGTEDPPSVSPAHGGEIKMLKIAQYSSLTPGGMLYWNVPEESRLKFNKLSLDLSVIDGGVI